MADPETYEWNTYAEGENPYANPQVANDAAAPAPSPVSSYGEEMQWNTYAEGENPYQKQTQVDNSDYGWGIVQAFKRGGEMISALPDIAQGDHEELAGHFQRMEELGRSDEDTANLRKIQESDGWWNTTVEIFKNPALTMQVVAESLPNMIAPAAGALAGGLAGTAAAGPIGGAAGTMTGAALGSFSTEYLHGLSNFFAEEGIDMTDGQALKRAFADDELMSRARDKAAKGGIPVAIFDGLSFGLAGKIYKIAEGGSLAMRTAAGTGEAAMQSGFGAAGEAGKQLVTEGEITSKADVLFEAVAELPGTIVEPVIARVVRGRQAEQEVDSLAEQLDAPLSDEIVTEMETTPGGGGDALSMQASRAKVAASDARDILQTQQYEQMARNTAFEKEERALVERTFEESVRENNRISMAFMENEAQRDATLERHRQAAEYQQALQEGEAAEALETVQAEPMPGTALGDALTAAQAESETKTAKQLETEGKEVEADALTAPVKPDTPKPTKAVNMDRDSFLTTRAKLPAGQRLSQKSFGAEGLDIEVMRNQIYKGRPGFSRHPDAWGPDDVAEYLNEQGYPSRDGKPWDANSALDAVTEEAEGRQSILTGKGMETAEAEANYAEELDKFESETARRAEKGPPKVWDIDVDGTSARVSEDPDGDVEVTIGDTQTITERKKGETNADLVRAVIEAQPEVTEKLNPWEDKTDLPDVDDAREKPEYFREKKNIEVIDVDMTPQQYLKEAAKGFGTTVKDLRRQRAGDHQEAMVEAMRNGDKFPRLYLDNKDGGFGQEGIHRAIAAERLGVKTVPVAVRRNIGTKDFSNIVDEKEGDVTSDSKEGYEGAAALEKEFNAAIKKDKPTYTDTVGAQLKKREKVESKEQMFKGQAATDKIIDESANYSEAVSSLEDHLASWKKSLKYEAKGSAGEFDTKVRIENMEQDLKALKESGEIPFTYYAAKNKESAEYFSNQAEEGVVKEVEITSKNLATVKDVIGLKNEKGQRLNPNRRTSISHLQVAEVVALKKAGFDGATGAIDNVGGTETVVFSPEQVSVVGETDQEFDDSIPYGEQGTPATSIDDFDAALEQAATSPKNNLPEPTEAQKEAGNYKKAHIQVEGLDIAIENPVGSTRRGMKMKDNYGYVKRTEGADGDQVDVFVNPKIQEGADTKVYVIDQTKEDGVTFDEHKVMIGYNNQLDAARGYKRNYNKGWKVGPITEMSMPEFKAWLSKDTTVPVQPKPSRAARKFVRDKKGKVRYSLREHKKAILADAKESVPSADAAFIKHVLGQPAGIKGLDGISGPIDTQLGQMLVDGVLAVAPFNTIPAIKAAVQKMNKMFPSANIKVVENYSQISEAVTREIEKDGNGETVRGIYVRTTDEIYLITDNLMTEEAAMRTALHEIAHKGLRHLLGNNFEAVMLDIYANLSPKQQKALAITAKSYKLDLSKPSDQATAVEELVAKLAETSPKNSAVQKVVAAIRKLLRKLGVVSEWSESDVVNLIAEAQGVLKRSQPPAKVITEQVQVEETGEVFDIEMDAEVALRQHDKRVDVVTKLRACL
jgi:hypothetical protein